jgi:hypothetical protein
LNGSKLTDQMRTVPSRLTDKSLSASGVNAARTQDVAALHAGYAQQAGYQQLIAQLGDNLTFQAIERLRAKHGLAGDARDVLAARDSLACLLGLWPYET